MVKATGMREWAGERTTSVAKTQQEHGMGKERFEIEDQDQRG